VYSICIHIGICVLKSGGPVIPPLPYILIPLLNNTHPRISLKYRIIHGPSPRPPNSGGWESGPPQPQPPVDAYMSIHYRLVGLLLGHLRRSATLVSFSFNKGSSSKNGCIPHCKLQYTATYSYPAVWHSKTLPRIHFLWLPM